MKSRIAYLIGHDWKIKINSKIATMSDKWLNLQLL